MKPLSPAFRVLALPLAAAVLTACDTGVADESAKQVDRARAEAKAATEKAAEHERRARELETKLADAETEEAELRASIAGLTERAALVDELEKKGAEAETLRHEKEKRQKELDLVTSHRDELREWVEEELLPIAETHDPKLANLRDAARDMAKEVERLRGIPFRRPFMRRLLQRDELGDWLLRDMKKDMPEDEVRKLVIVGAEFGLLKPDVDVYQIFESFLEAGVAAFYRPETDTFYHVEGNDGPGARPVVFHELVHAVEDQHFELDEMYRAVEEDSDRALAVRGLVEGSASWFAGLYEEQHPDEHQAMMQSQMTPEMMQRQQRMLFSVPPFLVATFALYPYQNGKAWIGAIGADTPEEMERLFRDPPVSTEQVLHPEKFPLDGARDYPRGIAMPDLGPLVGEGWEKVDEDGMGELMTGILLAQLQWKGNLPVFQAVMDPATGGVGFKKPAKQAVEGWDGDRYVAWRNSASDQVTILWVTVWDSDADAVEFAETYGPLLGKKVLGKQPSPMPSPVRFTTAEGGPVSGVEVAGNRVVVVMSAPSDKADALFGAGAAAVLTPDSRDANDR